MKLLKTIGFVSLGLSLGCSTKTSAGEHDSIHQVYLEIFKDPQILNQELRGSLIDRWKINHTPLILEVDRFSRNHQLSHDLLTTLKRASGQKLGEDRDQWRQWLWKQNYQPLKNYPEFKSRLYRRIDPRFAKYFHNDRPATIRLDEVRWGGVVQDGIPPLRKPQMISPSEATYLSPGNIVFGIEVNGEARAYPKRILAWHEMFVDTIQGIPLAGVY